MNWAITQLFAVHLGVRSAAACYVAARNGKQPLTFPLFFWSCEKLAKKGDIGVMPNGIYLGFRAYEKTPKVCMICLNIPGKPPREFLDIGEFTRHLIKEHRFYFWKPKFYVTAVGVLTGVTFGINTT